VERAKHLALLAIKIDVDVDADVSAYVDVDDDVVLAAKMERSIAVVPALYFRFQEASIEPMTVHSLMLQSMSEDY
jgi:hypothetical protein